jgi:hypothetical protein
MLAAIQNDVNGEFASSEMVHGGDKEVVRVATGDSVGEEQLVAIIKVSKSDAYTFTIFNLPFLLTY